MAVSLASPFAQRLERVAALGDVRPGEVIVTTEGKQGLFNVAMAL